MARSRSSQNRLTLTGQLTSTGQLAEQFVAQWLQQQGWQILAQRWHCRWGELDIVAIDPPQSCLVFVEVKARRRGNWDADGLLAITPTKREKLAQAAQLFLAANEPLAALPCRFDVAAVRINNEADNPPVTTPKPVTFEQIQLGRSIQVGTYWLTLHHYIPAAFDVS